MPDTLMLPFQRPSDEVLNAVRACRTTGFDRGDEWSCQAISDGLIDEQTLSLTRLGRLVLAACDTDANNDAGSTEPSEATGKLPNNPVKNTDAPDPVGRVVEAARVYMSAQDDWANSLAYGVGHLTDRLEAGLQDARRNLRKVLDELDRATGKAGEVG